MLKIEEKIALGATRPADPLNIPLGSEAFDALTGVQGVVSQKMEQLGGNIRYVIQPMGDGQSIPEALFMDWHTILIIGDGVKAAASAVKVKSPVPLGSEVEHQVTGVKGIVTERITFMNGCEWFTVGVKPTKDAPHGGSIQDSSFLFKKIGKGLVIADDPANTKEANDAVKAKPPGGPMIRVARPVAVSLNRAMRAPTRR